MEELWVTNIAKNIMDDKLDHWWQIEEAEKEGLGMGKDINDIDEEIDNTIDHELKEAVKIYLSVMDASDRESEEQLASDLYSGPRMDSFVTKIKLVVESLIDEKGGLGSVKIERYEKALEKVQRNLAFSKLLNTRLSEGSVGGPSDSELFYKISDSIAKKKNKKKKKSKKKKSKKKKKKKKTKRR